MRLISLLIFFLQFSSLHSQENVQKSNFVYLEGLGSAGYYSLNYEKTLFKSPFSRTYIRVGLGVTYDSWIKDIYPNKPKTFFLTYSTPIILGNEIGSKNLKYEYGLGIDLQVGENIRHYNMLVANKNTKYLPMVAGLIGLRYYCKKKPIFFRLTYTPFYDPSSKTYAFFWIGGSVGIKF